MISSETYQVEGYRLHCLAAGAGPPVILLHGFVGSADDWRPTLELLAGAGYRAIAIDALGFGASDKPVDAPYSLELQTRLYAGLLARLGIVQAGFAAHSMGGKYALAMALLHPECVSRIMLVDSDGFQDIPAWMQNGGNLPWLGEIILNLVARPAIVRAQLRTVFYDPERFATPELIERGVAMLAEPANRAALLALSRNYSATDLKQTGLYRRLAELTLPILIVWGSHDRIFPPACGDIAQQALPGSCLVKIPRSGHFPQIEAFRAFHGLLLGFLAAD
jgi:pimeloyl-ACP methyl ester carboxylesterase